MSTDNDMNNEFDIMNAVPCDLVIMPHGTGLYKGDTEVLLTPSNITITDVCCSSGHTTLSLDDLIAFYEQHVVE